ncbi:MAG TPA: hypothetical protein VGH97_04315 [Thermoanaerobaculia bacterium]
MPGAALAVVLLASVLGLLCTRIGDYDDGILLLGARLVLAGKLPYRDFYAHYGPFGFSLQALFSGILRNPPVALRMGESIALVLLGVAGFVAGRRRAGAVGAWSAAAYALVLSAAASLASFYGVALCLAALGAFAMASSAGFPGDGERAAPEAAATRWAAVSGVFLALAVLTRPAFAAYSAVALAGLGLAAGTRRDRARLLPILAVSCAATLVAAWLILYRDLSPIQAFDATVLFPRRLLEGGLRYREASFLRAPLPVAFLLATLHAALPLLWTLGLPSRRGRLVGAAAILASGALPLWLRVSTRPERDGVLVAAGAIAIALVLIARERRALRENAALRVAALFGLAAAASEHYLWARADRPHFLPLLVIAAAGAAAVSVVVRPAARALLLGLFAFVCGTFLRSPVSVLFPAESLSQGGLTSVRQRWRAPHASWKSVWPCGDIAADAHDAVAFADRHADPGSLFVAVASNQSFADQDPILLFLLSARLPYTRWYQYDTGVQDTAAVQRQMLEELESSGSRTAVVWSIEGYGARGPEAGGRPRTPFDEAFDRLYPVRGPRFGLYETRLRAGAAPSP